MGFCLFDGIDVGEDLCISIVKVTMHLVDKTEKKSKYVLLLPRR